MTALEAFAADSGEKLKERVDRYIREQIFRKGPSIAETTLRTRARPRLGGPHRGSLKELEAQGLWWR